MDKHGMWGWIDRRLWEVRQRWARIAALLLLMALVLPAGTSGAAPGGQQANAPGALQAVAVTVQEIDLSWTAPTSGTPSGYRIVRNGHEVAQVDASALSYVDGSVQPSTNYVYTVRAVDAAGQASPPAQPARIKTPGRPENPDTTPPTPPEQLLGTTAGGAVYLEWDAASDDTDVSAYVVRRNGKILATLNSGTQTYVDTQVQPSTHYTYAVEAVDVVGNRSRPSDPLAIDTEAFSPAAAPSAAAVTSMGAETAMATNATAAVSGYDAKLRRYPYLTDLVQNYVTVNWATDRSATSASVKWGKVGAESCTAHTTSATRTAITVNSVAEYQWKANLTLAADTAYCYRIYLGTTNLLGSGASPRFRTQVPAGSTQSFTFAVIGDWGATDGTGKNVDQANLMNQVAASGARFAISTGDNGYPSGSQTNYGDLAQTGASISGVFGPNFWAKAGASLPLFAAIGNHGFNRTDTNHPHLVNWPQDRAVATSGGRYTQDTYCCLNGTTSASYPSTWYAFDAGKARFYVLQTAWSDSNVGTATSYKDDYDYQWATSRAQYQWLQNDLAAHPGGLKFAFFHYPLYSDNSNETADTYLQGAGSLEGLLNRNGVAIAFVGHSHNYQRFLKPNAGSLVSYLTGGTGAKLTPINTCASYDGYAIGWSYSANGGAGGGSSCHATKPTARSQVFHYLLVTVNGTSVTVKPIDSLGNAFDVQSYSFK